MNKKFWVIEVTTGDDKAYLANAADPYYNEEQPEDDNCHFPSLSEARTFLTKFMERGNIFAEGTAVRILEFEQTLNVAWSISLEQLQKAK